MVRKVPKLDWASLVEHRAHFILYPGPEFSNHHQRMSAIEKEKMAKATKTEEPETTAPLLKERGARCGRDEEAGENASLWALPGQKIKVLAPTDLYSGYQFVVDVGDESYLVETTKTVSAGTIFEPTVVEQVDSDSYASAVPAGEWRNGLWHCKTGTSCLAGWFCQFVSVGQLYTRLGVGFKGLFGLFMVLNVIDVIVRYGVNIFLEDDEMKAQIGAIHMWCILLPLTFVILRARMIIAKRYAIPSFCLADYMIVLFCTPCTIIQMLQHTNNEVENPASCCSADGLSKPSKVKEHGKMNAKFIKTTPLTV